MYNNRYCVIERTHYIIIGYSFVVKQFEVQAICEFQFMVYASLWRKLFRGIRNSFKVFSSRLKIIEVDFWITTYCAELVFSILSKIFTGIFKVFKLVSLDKLGVRMYAIFGKCSWSLLSFATWSSNFLFTPLCCHKHPDTLCCKDHKT